MLINLLLLAVHCSFAAPKVPKEAVDMIPVTGRGTIDALHAQLDALDAKIAGAKEDKKDAADAKSDEKETIGAAQGGVVDAKDALSRVKEQNDAALAAAKVKLSEATTQVGVAKDNVKKAKAELKALTATMKAAEGDAKDQLETAKGGVESAHASVDLAAAKVDLADKQVALLRAQRDLVAAQLEEAEARAALLAGATLDPSEFAAETARAQGQVDKATADVDAAQREITRTQ